MYSLRHKVRYSEISPDRRINVAQVARYFQDCSTLDSNHVGDTLDHLLEQSRVWLLAAWQVEIMRYPELFEEIVISTWPHDKKGILAYRNFDICDLEGNRLISANSMWFYYDLKAGVPTRIMDEDIAAYGQKEKLPMNYKGRKITLPKTDGEKMDFFTVRRSDLDTNGHVNNTKYIEMALEYMKDSAKIVGMRADYRKSALYGDRIFPVVYEDTNRWVIALNNEEQEPFVLIEFEIDGDK